MPNGSHWPLTTSFDFLPFFTRSVGFGPMSSAQNVRKDRSSRLSGEAGRVLVSCGFGEAEEFLHKSDGGASLQCGYIAGACFSSF
jgi:hypothetical protein